MLCSVSAAMGGNKLRLSHRKRKSQLSLVVSLPLSLYSSLKINSLSSLHSSLLSQPLPESWTIAAKDPLTLVKLRVVCQDFHPQVDPLITLAVHSRLTWTLSVLNKHLDPAVNPSLTHLPSTLTSAKSVQVVLQAIDSLTLCLGNPDQKFQDLWKHRSVTLHGSSGIYVYMYSYNYIIR